MKELINIHDQHFYSASVEELLSYCSDNKCAVIIGEDQLKELIDAGTEPLQGAVNQIIIISENVNTALSKLIGVEIFLMAASGFEQAVRFAMQSSTLNDTVVCVLDEDQTKAKELIEMVVV